MKSRKHDTGFVKNWLKTAMPALLFLFATVFAKAQTPTAAYQVKAVFLFNFTQFVNWPPASFEGGTSPFVIAVLGSDPFGSYLEKVIENERVGNHPIKLVRFADAKEVHDCHILFVNKITPAETLKDFNRQSMLTVGDTDNFARDGGIIRFYEENHKLRLQINATSARAANLTISSKLLRLADVIDNTP